MFKSLFAIVLFLAQAAIAEDTSFLLTAHRAYQSGDLKEMTTQVKRSFQANPGNEVLAENAFNLLEASYSLVPGREGLPCDFDIPKVIKKIKISVRNGGTDAHTYRGLGLSLRSFEKGLVEQIQIIRHADGLVVMDKQDGVGFYEEEFDKEDNQMYYEIYSEEGPSIVKGGLYMLNIALTSGEKVNGWFLVNKDMNSTDLPVVHSPKHKEIVPTQGYEFSFDNFISPEYKDYESRTLWSAITKLPHSGTDQKKRVWSTWMPNPQVTKFVPNITLEKGTYRFSLVYQERKMQCGLLLARHSTKHVRFKVK